MFDTELALDTLSQIKDTLSMIMARTSHIHKVDDFYMNESGNDSIRICVCIETCRCR